MSGFLIATAIPTTMNVKNLKAPSELERLLQESKRPFPKVGDLIEGTILNIARGEILIDIDGLATGMVRGRELKDESGQYANLKIGDRIVATVIETENEKGALELSLRQAGHQKAWGNLLQLQKEQTIIDVEVVDANRGGLLVRVGQVTGFLPVSQLNSEHYPRVEGGDKTRILEKLRSLVNQTLKVKVLDVAEHDNKLIVSEKAAGDEKQKELLSKYKVGDTVEGTVSGVVDFGAFIQFDGGTEGLVHISELAWQRIDHPKDVIQPGQAVQAKIIGLDNGKISLSIKALQQDPWVKAAERYQVGQVVPGKVLKVNPFGLFVELDAEIHGLAHISQLSTSTIRNITEFAKQGDTLDFKIISIDPQNHRLGLSIRAITEQTASPEPPASGPKELTSSPETRTETPAT